jgi:phosphoserine phosphatase
MQPDPNRHVMTLIAGPRGEHQLPELAAKISTTLKAEPDWLGPGEACDIVFHGDAAAAETLIRATIGTGPIDVIVQPAAGRRKKVLGADLESTIIENEMLEELAEFVGLRAHVAEITRRAMNGEIDFVGALIERVAVLRGLSVDVLEQASERIRLMPGAATLLATMREAGARTALVSGGFSVFAVGVAAALGFDRVVSNRLDIAGGKLAGTVRPPIVTAETKRDTLLALAAECEIAPSDTLAVGDGANDLPMLLAAGLGIAFRAQPAVAAAARWRIDHGDLTALLYAQGYRRADFVSD